MPYFVWKGVDLHANIKKGVQFAPSQKELDLLLFKREIALLSARVKRSWNFLPIDLAQKIDYFSQLSSLLKAGIRLPEALELIAQQQTHARLVAIAYEVAHKVRNGIPLHAALGEYPHVFEDMIVQLIQAGQESGNLVPVIEVVQAHLESVATFKAQIRKAIVVPVMTFGFFILVLLVMFIFIVPQFASLFQSVNKSLPATTYYLLGISEFLRSWKLPVIVMVFAFVFMLLRKTKSYKKWAENIWINIVFIGDIIKQRAQASFLSSTAFLLQGGLPITTALSLAKGAVPSAWLHAKINRLAQQVEAGNSLYDAMMQDPEQIWSAQMLALIKVGQESGSLVPVLQKGAHMYQTNINKSLNRIATIIQPTLMLILGLLITLLIIALYEPIFTLSYVVGI